MKDERFFTELDLPVEDEDVLYGQNYTEPYVWKSKIFDTPVPSNVVVLVDVAIK